MVDPVTAALTGIALVTKVSDTIKQGIGAYRNVAEMGEQLEQLFRGEQECMAARNRKESRHSNFSTEGIAQEVIEHFLQNVFIGGYREAARAEYAHCGYKVLEFKTVGP